MKIRAILFDLDGTLIDQFHAIHSAFSKTLVEMGFSPPTFEEVKRAVGGSSDSTMRKLIGPDRADDAVAILRPIFEKEMFNGLHTLPGTTDGLKRLNDHGFKCAVLTNKFGPHARSTCEHLGLNRFLEFTIGANDTEWRKPDPKLTKFALKKLGFGLTESIFVGDSPYDFKTAKNAGLRSYLVATGTHTIEELSALQQQDVYPNFQLLVESLIST